MGIQVNKLKHEEQTEHDKAIYLHNWNDSALSEHTKVCNEGVNWDNFQTMSTQPDYFKRSVMEALEIQREEVCNVDHPLINDRAGQYVTTNVWKPLFAKIGIK